MFKKLYLALILILASSCGGGASTPDINFDTVTDEGYPYAYGFYDVVYNNCADELGQIYYVGIEQNEENLYLVGYDDDYDEYGYYEVNSAYGKISKGGIIEIDHDVFDCSGQFDGATIPLKCSWADSYREQEGFNQKSCDFELEQY